MKIEIVHPSDMELLERLERFVETHRPAGVCLPQTPEGDAYFEASFAVQALMGSRRFTRPLATGASSESDG